MQLDAIRSQRDVSQAEANVASADATVIEARSDRDQQAREATRLRDIRSQNGMLVSQQEVDLAASRSDGGAGRRSWPASSAC